MIALKLWYDGSGFFGFQRQPSLRTVESELFSALETIGVNPKTYRAAGRTDRGVSALGMVVRFDVQGDFRIGELNAALPEDVKGWAFTRAPFKFKPRYPKERIYRYVLPRLSRKKEVEQACGLLKGEHSFHNFSKFDKSKERDPIRKITGISLIRRDNYDVIELRGESFLWQMVRRIVTALTLLDNGRLSLQEFEDLLNPDLVTHLEPMPAEGLILMDIIYEDLEFEEDKKWKGYIDSYLKRKTNSYFASQEGTHFLLKN